MRTLVCTKPGLLEYSDAPVPVNAAGSTLLRIRRIGICGTDLHAFEGTQPYFSYPRVLGHELAAEIVKTDHTGFEEGEAVTFIPYFNCGRCIACKNDKPNCCTAMKVCGVHIDGGMADYLSVPSSSLVKSQGLGLDELALIEPLAIGAHAVAKAAIRENEFVLIAGAGPIGLGIIEFAKLAGATVIVLDINDERLDFCKVQLSVQHTINGLKENVMERLQEITKGDMPTVVMDATGNLKAIHSAFEYMAHGARYVLVGLQKEEIRFSHPEFHKREGALMSSRNATRDDFGFVITSIKERKIDPLKFISHKVSFDRLAKEFPSYSKPGTGVIKAMVQID
ncbi:MAG: zinc-binding alcohol dehydrogenase family protein [Ferruginibacter sp.]|nr:zinc-binding alcohol dehydrogenase family protein [Chitinophagaceae bacterium]